MKARNPWLKRLFFNLIRPLFVKDIDVNEDFVCGFCCEPVLWRVLFCSKACLDASGFDRIDAGNA